MSALTQSMWKWLKYYMQPFLVYDRLKKGDPEKAKKSVHLGVQSIIESLIALVFVPLFVYFIIGSFAINKFFGIFVAIILGIVIVYLIVLNIMSTFCLKYQLSLNKHVIGKVGIAINVLAYVGMIAGSIAIIILL
ncbi:MAG: hypothetical protein RR334_02545 [Clostridia bacterium]